MPLEDGRQPFESLLLLLALFLDLGEVLHEFFALAAELCVHVLFHVVSGRFARQSETLDLEAG